MRQEQNNNFKSGRIGRSGRTRMLPALALLLLITLLPAGCQSLPQARASLPAAEPEASAEASLVPLETSSPSLIRPVLHAYSSNHDLLIRVTDESGAAFDGVVFPLSVEYPHGVGFGMETGTDGSLFEQPARIATAKTTHKTIETLLFFIIKVLSKITVYRRFPNSHALRRSLRRRLYRI